MSRERGGITAKLIGLLCFVLLLTAIYAVRHPLLRFAGEELVVEDPLQKSDAIIMLSADNFYADRATRSAEIYRQGLAPIVVASGERLRPYAGIAELMEHDLIERGVPKEKILRFAHDADSTREEARALAKLANERKWRSVIVVTSNYHTRRARYIFEKVFPEAISVRVAAARDGDFDPESWFEKRKGIKLFFREMTGMAAALWESREKTP
ncbi:MAG: YdcF family protein [Acidobacteria bacterium]|nr:YdcF family protein [Acidobacteriota bacterium]MBS1865725.1 YdcF family protein [Acidobacteriota bacterium]